MENLETKLVPFMGSELMAARDDNGEVWVAVRWICDGIGFSEGQRKRQIANIQDDDALSEGGSKLILPTNGGNQEALCLKLDYVPLWLAKIPITPTMKRETPELARRLLAYQLKAKDALAAAFIPEMYGTDDPTQTRRQAITPQDCIKAAAVVAKCPKDRLPYVLSLLESGGFDLRTATTPPIEPERPCLQDLINAAVDEHGISMRRIAQLANMNRTQLYQYRAGRVPRPKLYERLVKAILAEIDKAKAKQQENTEKSANKKSRVNLQKKMKKDEVIEKGRKRRPPLKRRPG